MKNILLFTVALFIASVALRAQTVDTFPWEEGFENGTMPAGWTQEYVSGTVDWAVVAGNTAYPNAAHSGEYKARFVYAAKGIQLAMVNSDTKI